jgi:RNA polymerase-binding transcription factor DksA
MQEDQMELAQRQADMAIAKAVTIARNALLIEDEEQTLECVLCDKPIAEKRRLAMPKTKHCFDCATGIETRRRHR